MTLVRSVTGPTAAAVGDVVVYRVAAFSPARPSAAERTAVNWLVKSEDGVALASIASGGSQLEITVPNAWAGHRVTVMPYMRSPSAAIAVSTTVAADAVPIETPSGTSVDVRIEKDGKRYYASVNGEPRFFLGADVTYGNRRGLMNSANPPGPRYAAEEFEPEHGDWAWYLQPTITCESNRSFSCLNTYDSAALTFGHGQFAAHTPDDNFVLLFRHALALEPASAYFPDLIVKDGRIHCVTDDGAIPLESATSTRRLMNYFNGSPGAVDRDEADRAARLVHWCISHEALRDLLVAFFVRQQQAKLNAHARKLPLDGLSDKICIAVLDVLHQGRANYAQITGALGKADPFDALLALGAGAYRQRVATLRQEIQKLEARGLVGRKVFSRAAKEFVVPIGT